MRVVLVTSIPAGGPVEHAILLARELVHAGVTVRAIVCNEALAGRFAAVGAEPRVLPLRPGFDAPAAARLARACHGFDVVHSHDRRSGLWARLAPRPRRGGVRVHSLHGLPEPYMPLPVGPARPGLRAALLYGGVERALAARTDALVVPTHAAADLLAARVRYPRAALTVVPNGVDPVDAVAGTGELVGTVAALEPVKGVDVFLRAAAEVRRSRPSQRFAVAGEGSLESELRALAARLGLGDAVEFLGYAPSATVLPRLVAFVLASHMETSGMALLEAIAAGVPAIATRVGGIPETACGAELVPPNDPTALAAAILRVLDDPAAAGERAARAREDARREFTPPRTAAQMLAVYKRALDRQGRARGRGALARHGDGSSTQAARPRILMVVGGMGMGGAERIVVSLASHLLEEGHQVAVAAPAGALDAELAALGVARFTFPERGRSKVGALLSALAVSRAVRASGAEVVHAHNVKAAALAWAGGRIARRRVPVLVTFHGIAARDDAAAGLLLRRMDRIACVADELAGRLHIAGVPPERLLVVPNAVAPAERLDDARRAAIDEALELEGAPVVVAVGRLVPAKAHDRLLRAAALVPSDVRFLLVGDGPERSRLERLATELGLDSRVRFTGMRSDARELIARAQLVVFTSESEGLPLAALEALDADVPVLAPPVAGIRELVAAGACVPLSSTEPATIAAVIEGLLRNDGRRAELGAAGRALIRERYSPARMYETYDALYASLTALRA